MRQQLICEYYLPLAERALRGAEAAAHLVQAQAACRQFLIPSERQQVAFGADLCEGLASGTVYRFRHHYQSGKTALRDGGIMQQQ